MPESKHDAVIVGGGPNGLTAGIVLAQAGLSVLLLEANEKIGGGARTEELTLPGFRHDVCSAIHPMSLVSPFLRTLPLAQHGLEWAYSPIAIAHPLEDGSAAALEQSLHATAANLGSDGEAWRSMMEPFVRNAGALFDEILRPIRIVPRHPFLMARFGLKGIPPATWILRRFRTELGRALYAGCAAHSFVPLESFGSSSFGIALILAGHAIGWPCAKGGSEAIVRALAAHFQSLGGEIRTSHRVKSMRDIPQSRAAIFDVTPWQLADIAGSDLPPRYVRKLRRFKYGPGVFKIDYALDGPIPWKAEACRRAATVHVAGRAEEIAAHESALWKGGPIDKPFVLVAQQSLFDATRAPAGKHTGWAYCHVPHGSSGDMTDAIERQIERFAPGFRDRVLGRHTMNCADVEAHNANMIGGDIAGGANNLVQFLMRPFPSLDPYATPNERIYIGSSSTPPGAGVHGMCGYWAARSALRGTFGRR